MKERLPSTKILGTKITIAPKKQILEYIFKCIEDKSSKFYIVTPNPEILVYATRSRSYQDILNRAEVSLPDGVGILMAGKMLKKGISARITGVDMMELLCAESSKRAVTVGFVGGKGGVAEMAAECLREKYKQLRVIYADSEDRLPRIYPRSSVSYQRKSLGHIDILFVAMGAPKQEEWIAKNLPNINVSVAMGVGGAFDYISGKVPRAPKLVRKIGMEWAFRLVRQPWRLKRQMALPIFVAKVVKEKFS